MSPIEYVAVIGTAIGVASLVVFWWTTTPRAKRLFERLDAKIIAYMREKKRKQRSD